MIDTLVIRILNIEKYAVLKNQFYQPQNRAAVTSAYVDESTGEVLQNTSFPALVYHDTGRILPLMHRSSVNVASSHYTVSYVLNPYFLEFNFSLPKYLYSTNVMQFLSPHGTSSHDGFNMLKRFVYKFLNDYCLQQPESDDIEINRIDFCYNQFFNTKNDALQYLEHQQDLLRKYARSSKNEKKGSYYPTSLMYKTARYSFKIYHKGTEFAKHDFKELAKNNPFGYDIQYFQEQADTILRYEVTFRRSMLKYLLNHYFFNSKKESENVQFSEHILSTTFKTLIENGHKSLYEEFMNREKFLTLTSDFDRTNNIYRLFDTDRITFDETIFTILLNFFWKQVHKYQLTTGYSPEIIAEKIAAVNQTTAVKNNFRRKPESEKKVARLMGYALLTQFMKLDTLKDILPRSTYFDLQRDLKKIGVTANTTSLSIPQPRTDYYHYWIYFLKYHNNGLL